MDNDSKMIFEAMQTKWKLTSMHPAAAADKFGQDNVKVTPRGLRNGEDMVEVNVPVDDKGYDVAENEPHGYPGGVTAIQNLLINQLNKHGFALTKIHHADKDRDKYPTVFMHKKDGPMHKIAEIDGMGTINGEPYEEYMADLKNSADEDAESADEKKERVQRGWDMNKKRWAKWKMENPEAAAKHAAKKMGKSEDAEDDAEHDVPYASGQVGGRGEQYGAGEVKLLLLRDEKFDCYLNGTVQTVAFFRGTTFNCEPFDGEFYNCESDEHGTIAIPPDAHMKILEAPAGTTNTEDEDAENRLTYNAMDHLAKAAHEIRYILNSNADDEARTEHIIHMAQIILGDKKEHGEAEYRKMLEGLIVLLNRFIVVPMN